MVRDGLSVVPLAARIAALDRAASAEQLVDIALRYKVIRPLQMRSELLELARLVEQARPNTVLEIGTFRGGTLFVFARLAALGATIVSLDLPISPMGKLYRAAQAPLFHTFTRPDQQLHLLRADSHLPETADRVARILDGRPLDFLFIDGDHSYDGVKADYELHSRLVRPGGMIAFHDIRLAAPAGVTTLWNAVKSAHRHVELVAHDSQNEMGIGVIWM